MSNIVLGVLVSLYGEKSVEAGLVGGVWHFVGHTCYGLVCGNHQTGKVVGKMFSLGIVVK